MVHRRGFIKALGTGTIILAARGTAAASREPVKVGVITHPEGVHLDAYFPALAEAAEVQSVVVADPSGKMVADARRSLGDKLTGTYDSHEEMLKRERPLMALVSMEARLAPPVIQAALQAGCHVLAEKPACVAVSDFANLAALAESRQRHLMLAFANRLNPEVQQGRRLIREGRIGRIFGLEMHLVADQTRLTRPGYRDSWFAHKDRAGGGHLAWLGIHWLDLAMFLTGSRITQVSGFSSVVGGQPLEVEDSAALALQFDNGTFGTMTSGYYLDEGYHSHIKIWGSRGWLQIDTHGGTPLSWYSQDEPEPQIHRVEQFEGASGYSPFVRACVRAASEVEEPPLTTQDSLRAIEAVFAGYRAAETGQRQALS